LKKKRKKENRTSPTDVKKNVPEKSLHAFHFPALILVGGLLGAVFFGHLRAARGFEFHTFPMLALILLGAALWPAMWRLAASAICRVTNRPFPETWREVFPIALAVGLVFSYPVIVKDLPGVPRLFLFGLALAFIGLFIIAAWERKIHSTMIIFYLLLAVMITTQLYSECVYYKLGNLKQVMAGHAPPPWRYRILIPLVIRGFHVLVPSDPNGIMFFFRIFLLVMAFVGTKRLAQNWVRPETAAFAPLLYAFFLYPTYDLIVCTDFPEILFITLYLLAMVKKRHFLCLVLMIMGTANREVMAFMGVSYFVYFMLEGEKGERKKILLWTAAQAASWLLARFAILHLLGGEERFQHKFGENLAATLDYFRWLAGENHGIDPRIWWLENVGRIRRFTAFAAGAWILAILFWRRLPRFILINGLICTLLWVCVGFVKGNIHETRIFYPLLPFLACIVPILLRGNDSPAEPPEKPASS